MLPTFSYITLRKNEKHDHSPIDLGYYFGMGKHKIDQTLGNPNKIPKLTSFGITTSKSLVETKLDIVEADNMEKTPSRKTGKFLFSWKFNRPWLIYDSQKNLVL